MKKILLIDDEQIIRSTLKKILILDGYDVIVAEGGLQGLNLLEENKKDGTCPIRLVVLDVRMPGIDGIEVLKIVKEKYPDIEVILTTGHGAVETAIQALRFGAFDYIHKPIEYDELNLSISRALDKQENYFKRIYAENALRESEEKYRTLVEHASDGIAIIQEGILKYVNPRLSEILGYESSSMIGTPMLYYVHPDGTHSMKSYINYEGKHQTILISKSGKNIHIELNVGKIKYEDLDSYLVIFRDITERKEAEDRIKYLSFHDKLTGLYNRAFLEEEMNRLDKKRQLPISIIVADLNGLKLTNDGFGHHVGDQLLIEAASAIKKSCRAEDIISRWGGDEFVILLPKVNEGDLQNICDRIVYNCKSNNNLPVELSIAVGKATKNEVSQNINSVLREADDRMYVNKQKSGKSVRSSIISSLKKTLYEKNCETEDHCLRMEKLCERFGRKLNMPQNKVYELMLLGALHDIGKVTIPDEILKKPTRLSEEEMAIVQKHAEVGYRIVKTNIETAHIAEGIICHHERWDGKGYPNGLKGEEIPIEARIISIIDAYDVMINKRPYKEAISKEEAYEELRINKGTQFDPLLTDSFINMMMVEFN